MSVDALRERYVPALAAAASRRARRERRALSGHARARRDVSRGAGRRRASPGCAHDAWRGSCSRAAGRTPAGRRRSRARCCSGHAAAAEVLAALSCSDAARQRCPRTWPQPPSRRRRSTHEPRRRRRAAALEDALIRSAARGARVRKTGMGPDKSLAAAEALAREPGDALLVLGFCGGLDAHSRPGEVIVAERGARGRRRRARPGQRRAATAREQLAGGAARRGPERCAAARSSASARSPPASGASSCARPARWPSTWSRCGWPRARPGGRSASCASCSTAPATS